MSDTENVAAGEPEAKRMKKSPPANGKYGDAGNPGNDDSNDSTASNASTNDTAAVDSEDSNQGKTEAQKKVCVAGSDIAGAVLICGQMNWDMTGRSSAPKGQKLGGGRCVYNPSRLTHLKGVKVRSIISGCTSAHNLIITTEGKLMTFGRNDKGQLGHGDTTRRDVPTVVEELKDFNVVGGACGKNHTLVVTDRGTVFGFGDNKMGQCGAGANHQVVTVPTKLSKMKPIAIVACGGEFSMIADVDGNLYSFGLPEYGQLGHNTDGKFFITSSKLSFHVEHTPRRVGVFIKKSRDGTVPVDNVEIKDLACGANHTVALDSRGRIFTWGFGGYGRLGHNEPKDEMVPRLLEFFDGPNRGAKMVAAGSSYSLAVSSLGGTLLMWGQAKRTGEANMYPKPVQDLQGWNVRVLACSHTSMGVIAEDSVITWGPSPCYGELGLGMAVKSSSKPKEVSDLDEVKVLDMAMGMAHSLFIVADETDSDKTALDALPEYDPEEEATS